MKKALVKRVTTITVIAMANFWSALLFINPGLVSVLIDYQWLDSLVAFSATGFIFLAIPLLAYIHAKLERKAYPILIVLAQFAAYIVLVGVGGKIFNYHYESFQRLDFIGVFISANAVVFMYPARFVHFSKHIIAKLDTRDPASIGASERTSTETISPLFYDAITAFSFSVVIGTVVLLLLRSFDFLLSIIF